eukprot:CAMPEP_0184985194 /NCGR_PEP_ID=MMETSP1098-20130426/13988_1 /TAXON_ID=89044 /ORGANISM="Spumella elongata, Strain CCAP 955/1" /LENGTH=300 /DNA_ID=CAMNT_0027509271 /DNA_START=177 /DNA_END=1079 /DNA_ORIENTATION=-
MQNSSKATVFETTIPFQLAFFALVEHDTDTAPLWDPELRQFVGLMTLSDYIHALRVWRAQGLPTSDLTSKNIAEMMHSAGVLFRHAEFLAVDAEDSVHQMCLLLLRTENDYVPVVDADNGNLVSILGFLDVVALLHQAGQQYPNLFARSIRDANIGTFNNVITAPKSARLWEVLDVLEQKNLSGLPVVDEQNKVIGFYHRSEVSFIIKATDTDMVLQNLNNYRVEEALALREQLIQSGEIMSSFQGLAVCRQNDSLGQVLSAMVRARSCRVVVVNESQQCVGIISIRDIARYYISGQLGY